MEFIEHVFSVLAYVAVIGFLISGLDDLFFDSHFLIYLFRGRTHRPVTLRELNGTPEQRIALFVPAWQEGGVVNRMAEFAARVVRYEKYDIFIGVYPNDPETIECLDKVCAESPRIHKVVVPHPGPTSKADCLNWIYRAMRLHEVPGVREYQLIALHDAEDILHPLLLKVYNHFVPRRYDMGQVPVFALEHPVWRYWSANTYIDDFSELHTKDLFARESLGGVVPSAGVGTCFTRKAVDTLAADNDGDPFHIANLTEDYEVGIRLKRAGWRAGVINVPVERIVRKLRRDGTFGPPKTISELVAVREAFPATFWTAVRQRTRWILGISFQTWEQAGWKGSLATRYTLLRDRRAPLTHLINMTGYLTLAFVLFQWLFGYSAWADRLYIRPLFSNDSLLWKLVIVDTWLLAYRAAQKFISVYSVYNFKQACFSIPRVVVGNMINFVATVRACWIYVASKVTRRPIAWNKTQHVFPGENELREYAKSVEDLLVEQGLVTRHQILEALEKERTGSAPLCLLRMGLLDETHFTDVWARYSQLPVRRPDPARLPLDVLGLFSEEQSNEWGALPLERTEASLVAGFREPPTPAQVRDLARQLAVPVQPVLVRPSALSFARDAAYPRLALPMPESVAWTDRIRQSAGISSSDFESCLLDQQANRRNLVEILCDRSLIPGERGREIWADCLALPPATSEGHALDRESFYKVGPFFWWLHHLLPLEGGTILAAAKPHPHMIVWLETQLGRSLTFQAVLPSRLEILARQKGAEVDPDAMLLEFLAQRQLLPEDALQQLRRTRTVVTDSLHRWLLLDGRLSRQQLHQAFLELVGLPLAESRSPEFRRQYDTVLPPGFAREHGCLCLSHRDGLRIGLTQIPSRTTVRRLYERLEGYPLWFLALTWDDARSLPV